MRFIIISIIVVLTDSRSLVGAFTIVVFIIIEHFYLLVDYFTTIEQLEKTENMLGLINLPRSEKMESTQVIGDFK